MRSGFSAACVFGLNTLAAAQICGTWEPFGPTELLPGVTGTVRNVAWLDGPGGGSAFVSGSFSVLRDGLPSLHNFAVWGSQGWVPGPPITPYATASAEEAGTPVLYIAGVHNGAYRVARWDGAQLELIPGIFDNWPEAIAITEEAGERVIYLGGNFFNVDSTPVGRIARWDGQSWAGLGSGVAGGLVYSIAVSEAEGSRLVYVGGTFTSAGGLPLRGFARWDGAAWSGSPAGPLALNSSGSSVYAMHASESEGLYVGGAFNLAGTAAAQRVARLTTTGWQALGSGSSTTVRAMRPLPWEPNDLVIGTHRGLSRWDGVAWQSLGDLQATGASISSISSLAATSGPDPRLLVGGTFMGVGNTWSRAITSLGASGWQPAPAGTPPVITRIYRANVGGSPKLYVAGSFDRIGGIAASGIASWDGSSWQALDAGVPGEVWALVEADLGSGPRLFAGGNFSSAGGIAANNVAAWDGGQWSALGSGVQFEGSNTIPGRVRSLGVSSASGAPRLYVGGAFASAGGAPQSSHVAAWDGTSWFGNGLSPSEFGASVVVGFDGPNPGVYTFRLFGGIGSPNCTRWTGTAWFPVANFNSSVQNALQIGPPGNPRLLVSGVYTTIDGQPLSSPSIFDGTTWSATTALPLVTSISSGLASEPHVAYAIAGNSARTVYRWDGQTWTEIPGLNAGSIGNDQVTLAIYEDALGPALYVGGTAVHGGGSVASRALVRFRFCSECYANCDQSTAMPILNVADFTCFLQRFAAGDTYANCDNSTAPPVLNVADFTCFLQRFAAGCQ